MPPLPLTFGSWIFIGRSKTAAVSLARPIILRQSGLFGVISNSATVSSKPSTGLMSSPSSTPSSDISLLSSFKINIPLLSAPGISCEVNDSSSIEHSIPWEFTPRMFVFLISTPSGSVAPSRATGTISPDFTFLAPVTIVTISGFPTFTVQMESLSALGWGATSMICPTTTLVISAPGIV